MPVEDLLARRFIARSDVKAVQHRDGSWAPDRSKFTRSDLQDHLAGRRSLGHYMLSKDGKCKLVAFDIDLKKSGRLLNGLGDLEDANLREVWLDPAHPGRDELTMALRVSAEGLGYKMQRLIGIDVAIAYSGSKGLHVYGFFDRPVDAKVCRDAALAVLTDDGCWEPARGKSFWQRRDLEGVWHGFKNFTIEVFPKQDDLGGKDLGNLMRLPLGVNARSGHEAFFLDCTADLGDGFVKQDPEAALTAKRLWPPEDD